MDQKKLKNSMGVGFGGLAETKEAIVKSLQNESKNNTDEENEKGGLDPNEALELFLNRIALSSIPGVHNVGVLEIKANDTIQDAITCLYKRNVMGAPVLDETEMNDNPLTDQYVGLVEFAGMVLWALQELKIADSKSKLEGLSMSSNESSLNFMASENAEKTNSAHHIEYIEKQGFFAVMKHLPEVGLAKVGALARSFRWGPFLPVYLDDSLLHVLLLLSKHRLKEAPVIVRPDMHVKGFITQNAAVQLLLQCSGLQWFDVIAEETLFDSGFQKEKTVGQIVHLYGNQYIINAVDCLWKHRISAVPVLDWKSKKILGHVRNTDMRLLLDNKKLFSERRTLTIEEFMKTDDEDTAVNSCNTIPVETDFAALLSAGILSLKNVSVPKMLDPPTSQASDTLKMTMEKIVLAKSDRSFIINENREVVDVITLRDIIIKFAPPSMNSSIKCGGFFQSALEQTSSTMEGGTIVPTKQL